MGRSPDCSLTGTATLVSGVAVPESIRAAAVSTFCTLPGSYGAEMARFPRSSSSALASFGVEARPVGQGQQLAGLDVQHDDERRVGLGLPQRASRCSAAHCTSESRVSW